MGKLDFVQSFCCKPAMADYAREITAKSCKYGKYGFFVPLIMLFVVLPVPS